MVPELERAAAALVFVAAVAAIFIAERLTIEKVFSNALAKTPLAYARSLRLHHVLGDLLIERRVGPIRYDIRWLIWSWPLIVIALTLAIGLVILWAPNLGPWLRDQVPEDLRTLITLPILRTSIAQLALISLVLFGAVRLASFVTERFSTSRLRSRRERMAWFVAFYQLGRREFVDGILFKGMRQDILRALVVDACDTWFHGGATDQARKDALRMIRKRSAQPGATLHKAVEVFVRREGYPKLVQLLSASIRTGRRIPRVPFDCAIGVANHRAEVTEIRCKNIGVVDWNSIVTISLAPNDGQNHLSGPATVIQIGKRRLEGEIGITIERNGDEKLFARLNAQSLAMGAAAHRGLRR